MAFKGFLEAFCTNGISNQDLYDLSVECFRELAGRIDDLALELNLKPGAKDASGSPTVRPVEEVGQLLWDFMGDFVEVFMGFLWDLTE